MLPRFQSVKTSDNITTEGEATTKCSRKPVKTRFRDGNASISLPPLAGKVAQRAG